MNKTKKIVLVSSMIATFLAGNTLAKLRNNIMPELNHTFSPSLEENILTDTKNNLIIESFPNNLNEELLNKEVTVSGMDTNKVLGATEIAKEQTIATTVAPIPTVTPKPTTPSKPIVTPKPTSAPSAPLTDFQKLNLEYKEYGKFITRGLPNNKYLSTQNFNWPKGGNQGNFHDMPIDLTKKYTYNDLEKFMTNIANHPGVELSIIGKSVKGRKLYSIAIDYPSSTQKYTVMLSGQVHAREFAGSIFILKQLDELLKKADNDASVKSLLEKVRIIAVPVVNPDGREMIINGYNTSLKSNANGVDLNRNFPSINAGQVIKGVTTDALLVTKPGLKEYNGPYLGSEPETLAMISWFSKYIPTASSYIDYHQQGGVTFAGKIWDTRNSFNLYGNNASKLNSFLNSTSTNNYYTYSASDNIDRIDGSGGTHTDYATSIAMGFKYSSKFGRMALINNDEEMPLIQFADLDNVPQAYKPINTSIFIGTIEIGRGTQYLGYSQNTRNLLNEEYYKYNFSNMLEFLMKCAVENKVKLDNTITNETNDGYQRIRL